MKWLLLMVGVMVCLALVSAEVIVVKPVDIIGGNLTFNQTLADELYVLITGDTMTGDLLPSPTLSLDLGSGANRWDWLYVGDISADNIDTTNIDVSAMGTFLNINVTGMIYGNASGLTDVGFWKRTGTVLEPVTAGDDINVTGTGFLGTSLVGGTIATQFDLSDGLIHYWKLEENGAPYADSAGAGTGTAAAPPSRVNTIVSGSTGTYGQDFTPNDYITGTITELYNQDKTINAWIKMDTINRLQGIFSIGDTPTDGSPSTIFRLDSDNRLVSLGNKLGAGTSDYLETAEQLSVNTVYMVTLVEDTATLSKRIYINGVEATYVAGTTGLYSDYSNSGNNFYIGASYNNYFTGIIDEVGVWDRPLSDEEILQLYEAGNGIDSDSVISVTTNAIGSTATLPVRQASSVQDKVIEGNLEVQKNIYSNWSDSSLLYSKGGKIEEISNLVYIPTESALYLKGSYSKLSLPTVSSDIFVGTSKIGAGGWSGNSLDSQIRLMGSTSRAGRLSVEGSPVRLDMYDMAGGVNDKWIQFTVEGGTGTYHSYGDTGGAITSNILTLDLGNGDVTTLYNFHILADNKRIYRGLANDAYDTFTGSSWDFVANAITATDDMSFTADDITFNAVTDVIIDSPATLIKGTTETRGDVTFKYTLETNVASGTVNTVYGTDLFSMDEDLVPDPVPTGSYSSPYQFYVTFTSGAESGNSYYIKYTGNIGLDFFSTTGGATPSATDTFDVYEISYENGVVWNASEQMLSVFGNANVTGQINAAQYSINDTQGYSGTCINATYSGGIAISCND